MEKHNTCIYTDNPEKAREKAVSGMDAISISEEAISEAAFPISKNDAKTTCSSVGKLINFKNEINTEKKII